MLEAAAGSAHSHAADEIFRAAYGEDVACDLHRAVDYRRCVLAAVWRGEGCDLGEWS